MLRMLLAEAVALDEAGLGAHRQSDGFGNECEGHCGVRELSVKRVVSSNSNVVSVRGSSFRSLYCNCSMLIE